MPDGSTCSHFGLGQGTCDQSHLIEIDRMIVDRTIILLQIHGRGHASAPVNNRLSHGGNFPGSAVGPQDLADKSCQHKRSYVMALRAIVCELSRKHNTQRIRRRKFFTREDKSSPLNHAPSCLLRGDRIARHALHEHVCAKFVPELHQDGPTPCQSEVKTRAAAWRARSAAGVLASRCRRQSWHQFA